MIVQKKEEPLARIAKPVLALFSRVITFLGKPPFLKPSSQVKEILIDFYIVTKVSYIV